MKKTTSLTLIAVLNLSLVLAQNPPPSFVNTVAVGDSLTAGFKNGSLNEKGQVSSYAYLIAQQVGTYMFLPLIFSPGIPSELVLVKPGFPPVIEQSKETSKGRVFPLIVAQNLAVPGQNVAQALTQKPDTKFDGLDDLILGVPTLVIPLGIPPLSQIELAFVLKPTFTIFWLGNNDVLGAALAGDPNRITPPDVFQKAFATAVGTILASGSKIIVANIPDVTQIPYLSSAEQLAVLAGAPLAVIGPLLGIKEGDLVTAPGLALAVSILAGKAKGPLPAGVVLTAEEVAAVRAAAAGANAFIAALGAKLNFPVVDIHALQNQLHKNGLEVGKIKLTTSFLGGIFSLDGIHLTNTGDAIVANAFIDKMNEFYGLKIPKVDLAKIIATDPLVPKDADAELSESRFLMVAGEEIHAQLSAIFVKDPVPPEQEDREWLPEPDSSPPR